MPRDELKKYKTNAIPLGDCAHKYFPQRGDFIRRIRKTLEELGLNRDNYAAYKHKLLSRRIMR